MHVLFVLLRGAIALGLCSLLVWADGARRAELLPARARIEPLPSLAAMQTPSQTSSQQVLPQGIGHWERIGQGRIPMPPGVLAAHASTLVALPQSNPASLMAFWFAGDRESAPNVQIAMATLDRASGTWSDASLVVDRWDLAGQLGFGIRRLGNPVAWLDPQGQVHLYVVATGLGGWAAGRVLHLRQRPAQAGQAIHFEPLDVLPLSWMWNISYLVRTAPLALADGGAVLPAYFELVRKSAVAVRLNSQGNFAGVRRILANDQRNLQPALLALDESNWWALMRDAGPNGQIRVAKTHNGGRHWTDGGELALDNPDSSVATLSIGDQHLLVYNPLKAGRHVLDLAAMQDEQRWVTIAHLAQGSTAREFSYPAIAMADGHLWLSYTEDRKFIVWQRFAWVAGPPPIVAQSAGLP